MRSFQGLRKTPPFLGEVPPSPVPSLSSRPSLASTRSREGLASTIGPGPAVAPGPGAGPWEAEARQAASLAAHPVSGHRSSAAAPVRGGAPVAAAGSLLAPGADGPLESGEKLPAETRADFEGRFGHDFGQVRIHADGRAARSAEALGARAFTVGENVVFGPGQYSPGTPSGRRLLAHELTHVVQQAKSGVPVMQADGKPGKPKPPKTQDPSVLAQMQGAAQFFDFTISFFEVQGEIHGAARGLSGDEWLVAKLDHWKRTLEVALGLLPKVPGKAKENRAKLRKAYQRAVASVYRAYGTKKGSLNDVFRTHLHTLAWDPLEDEPQADKLSDALPENVRRRIQAQTTRTLTPSHLDLSSLFPKRQKKGKKQGVSPGEVRPAFELAFQLNPVPKEAELAAGLKNLASHLLVGMKPPALTLDSTVTLALDLDPFGFPSGVYRFTFYAAAGGGKGKTMLIELLGPLGLEIMSPTEVKAAEKKFKAHGFRFSGHWRANEKESVTRGVSLVPDSLLSLADGIGFLRESLHPTDKDAGGSYHLLNPRHTIKLYDPAFAESQVRIGSPGQGLRDPVAHSVAHEIGHAIDTRRVHKGLQAQEQADAALKSGFSRYETQPGSWSGIPMDRMAEFNKLLKTVNDPVTSQTETGHHWVKKKQAADELTPKKGASSKFTAAAGKDGGKAVSPYGSKSTEEAFAESFALYVNDPATLKRLRPKISEFFEKHFPK